HLSLLTIFILFLSFSFSSPPRTTLFPYTTLFRSVDAPHRTPRREAEAALTRSRALFESGAVPEAQAEIEHLGASWSQSYLPVGRSEEHTSELQSRFDLVCRLLLEKKNKDVTEFCI